MEIKCLCIECITQPVAVLGIIWMLGVGKGLHKLFVTRRATTFPGWAVGSTLSLQDILDPVPLFSRRHAVPRPGFHRAIRDAAPRSAQGQLSPRPVFPPAGAVTSRSQTGPPGGRTRPGDRRRLSLLPHPWQRSQTARARYRKAI